MGRTESFIKKINKITRDEEEYGRLLSDHLLNKDQSPILEPD